MAANGAPTPSLTPENVIVALSTLQGSDRTRKTAAHAFLEDFQKSKEAWTIAISILQSDADAQAKMFAATTLKGKIKLDLRRQVPEAEWPALRTQVIALLKAFAAGPKPVRVQLAVCLAILAIHMTDWKDVLTSVVASLGDNSHAAILDFLQVLPEEVTEGRKINLTEEALGQRTSELLGDNAGQVIQLLMNYAQSSSTAATNPQLMRCIASWINEVPLMAVLQSPLLDAIFNALDVDDSFESAIEALSSIFRQTREVDDSLEEIKILFPRVVALRSKLQKMAEEQDTETFKGLTRILADAGDCWVVLIAREPQHFKPLVDAILECCARDKDRDAIEHTFRFWDEFKQYLVVPHYEAARAEYTLVYSKLVDILMTHLEFPRPESGNETDLFDGDREQEEKFREYRHKMGDTLKDACEVMGTTACLTKVLDAIKLWMQKYASQATATVVPHWQSLEAPIFAMRAMGRMVDKEEDVVLKQLMPLLVQIPAHEKLRFAAVMVLGRYTEWTSAHPEFLTPQFNYIATSFDNESKEVIRAAAMSMKFFCVDCKHLLADQVLQLQQFYNQVLDKLPDTSQEDLTEGVATVISAQPPSEIYKLLKLYCDPLVQRLMVKADQATDGPSKCAVADHLLLITLFVQIVVPFVKLDEENPAVKYWQEVFPILATIAKGFDFPPILERVCRCWRHMVISYRTAVAPILGDLATELADGFARTKQGCFLWASGSILREFSEDREHVDETTAANIYQFAEAQITNVLRVMSDLHPREASDVIEDFFRLLTDALLYYPHRLIPSPLFTPILEAAISTLSLEQKEPLQATLHYLRDLLTYGGDNLSSSFVPQGRSVGDIQAIVKRLLLTHGEPLIKQVMAGMMITFPRDCFPDGSGVMLAMFEQFPQETTVWLDRTIRMLPEGTVTPAEADRLTTKIKACLSEGDKSVMRKVRTLLQDFTNSYRRRYIAPRDGLGQLEARRFHFDG